MHTRETIIRMLKRRKWTIPQLAKEFDTSEQAIAYHIRILKSRPSLGLCWERLPGAANPNAKRYWIEV
jgi:hypothetical protein